MSADGSIDLVFGGDERHFRLAIDNLIALQEKCDRGPMEIAKSLRDGTWRVEYVIETLRIGLIGGGTGAPDDVKAARKLVEDNVRPGNIVPHALTAFAVLISALQGDPDDPVGKEKATPDAPEAATASPPPPSTDQAQ